MNEPFTPLPRHSIPKNILLTETAQLIAEGYIVTLLINGNSMNPFLHDGRDRVLLAPFTPFGLRRGAVILTQCHDEQFVLHRIIARHGSELLLMGDGNPYQKETCSISQVIGIVTTVIRRGKPYPCTSFPWRAYSVLWVSLRPLRRPLLWAIRRLSDINRWLSNINRRLSK